MYAGRKGRGKKDISLCGGKGRYNLNVYINIVTTKFEGKKTLKKLKAFKHYPIRLGGWRATGREAEILGWGENLGDILFIYILNLLNRLEKKFKRKDI